MNGLIDAALINRLKTAQNLPPLQTENTAITAKTSFARATIIRTRPDALSVGVTGRDKHSNFMQVDVFVPLNTGTDKANELADAIIAVFPRGLRLTAGDYFVHVTRAYRETASRLNDNFHNTPVIVDYSVIV